MCSQCFLYTLNFDVTNIEEVGLKIRQNKTTMLFKEFWQYLYKKAKPNKNIFCCMLQILNKEKEMFVKTAGLKYYVSYI